MAPIQQFPVSEYVTVFMKPWTEGRKRMEVKIDTKRFVGAAAGTLLCLILIGGSPVMGATEKTASDQAIPFPDIPRMTKEQLKEMLGTAGLVVLDCRPEEQWRISDQMIPGSVHENPMEVKSWADKYSRDSTIVIY